MKEYNVTEHYDYIRKNDPTIKQFLEAPFDFDKLEWQVHLKLTAMKIALSRAVDMVIKTI